MTRHGAALTQMTRHGAALSPSGSQGPWGLTSAVPAPAGAAEAASGAVLGDISAALALVWGHSCGDLSLTHACPACGGTDHGTPVLSGLPPQRTVLVSFTHVDLPAADGDAGGSRRVRHRVGAWWVPEAGTESQRPDGGAARRRLRGHRGKGAAHARVGFGVDLTLTADSAFATPDGLGAVAFSAAEQSWISRHAAVDRPTARARLWTRKEALVKAAGTGFTGDPSAVDALRPPCSARLIDLGGPRTGHAWRDLGAALPPGVVGAVVLRPGAD